MTQRANESIAESRENEMRLELWNALENLIYKVKKTKESIEGQDATAMEELIK